MSYMKLRRIGKCCGEGIEPSCGVFDVIDRYGVIKHRIVVDCGLGLNAGAKIGERNWVPPDTIVFQDGKKIDFVFLTHAHTDHVGYAPALVPFLAPNAKFWMSRPTAAIIGYGWEDSMRVAAKRQTDPPFTTEEMHACLDRIRAFNAPGEYALPGTDITVLVWPAGHINGACSYTFRVGRKHVHYAGDRCEHNQPGILGAKPLPLPWRKNLIIAGSDCTYGNDPASDTRDREAELARFHDATSKTVRNGGIALIHAFAIGRGTSMAHELTRRGVKSPAMVLLDGACRYYADEQRLPSGQWSDRDSPVDLDRVFFVGDGRNREVLRRYRGGLAVVTTSGMGGGGPSVRWLDGVAENPNASVFFTGYVAPGTEGDTILKAARERDRTGKPVSISLERTDQRTGEVYIVTYDLRCKVDQFRIGGHDSRQTTIDWFMDMNPEVAVLAHGGESSLASLSESLRGNIPTVISVDKQEMIEVDD